MEKMRRAATLLLALLWMPAPASAWGFEAHKFIVDKAIDLLPAPLKALFEKHRAFVIERSVDPDLWRTAGWDEEPPNHFVDIDHERFGPYPFEGLPRDYAAAVQKFGREFVHQQGLLPWRLQEFYGRLQREFESLKQPSPPGYARDNLLYFSAIVAHYVSDGHVPLHSVVNYDGQLTGQNGLHSRWEAELFERNRSTLKLAPAAIAPVTNPRDFMFDVLLASNRLSGGVLEADRAAVKGRDFYDDAYFEALRAGTWTVLERRVNDSIGAVVSVIVGAWEQAGRPTVPVDTVRKPRPVRRPPSGH
jgi:hypothetical protein